MAGRRLSEGRHVGGAMRKRALLIGGLGAIVLVAGLGIGHARKVVSVVARCPDGAADRLIDADGKKDRCTGTAKIGCESEQSLEVDAKEERDVCRKANGKDARPLCPTGFKQKVRLGEDACEASLAPLCRKGYKLKVRLGEDICVY